MTRVVTFESLPGPVLSLAAFCKCDFDSVVRQIGASAIRTDVISFKKKIATDLAVYLEISEGRYASISKFESQSEFEIGLMRVKWTFFRSELDKVLEFIDCPSSNVRLYKNPPIKWTASEATPEDLAYWNKNVGSAFPY